MLDLGTHLRGMAAYDTWTNRRLYALVHVFNHQTHHRAQAHAGLIRLGCEALVLDLLAMQQGAA